MCLIKEGNKETPKTLALKQMPLEGQLAAILKLSCLSSGNITHKCRSPTPSSSYSLSFSHVCPRH